MSGALRLRAPDHQPTMERSGDVQRGARPASLLLLRVLSGWVGMVDRSRLVSPNPRRDTYVRSQRWQVELRDILSQRREAVEPSAAAARGIGRAGGGLGGAAADFR